MRLILCLSLFSVSCATSGTGLNIYSYQQEADIGNKYSTEIERQTKIMNDPVLTPYIQELCARMLSRGGVEVHFDYKCQVVDSSEVNAFAIPGGHLYVNLALLKEATDESELVGVMGHEIGHVIHRHGTKRMTDAALVQLAAIGAAKAVGEEKGQYAGLGVMLFGQAGLLKYGRNAELESDRTGAQILYNLNYDAYGVVRFFEKLHALEKQHGVKRGGLSDLLATHPPTLDRIQQAKSYIATLPKQNNPVVSTPKWDEIKKYIAPMTPTPPKKRG